MFVMVQVVRISWSKASRGGHLASLRTAVPNAFSLNSDKLRLCNGIYTEEQHWSESNHFQRPVKTKPHCEESDSYTFRCATICRSKEKVSIEWIWNWQTGAPERYPARHQWTICPDEWLQLCWNGRFSDHDGGQWTYEEVTLNVAYTFQKPANNFFNDSQPSRRCDHRAQLW